MNKWFSVISISKCMYLLYNLLFGAQMEVFFYFDSIPCFVAPKCQIYLCRNPDCRIILLLKRWLFIMYSALLWLSWHLGFWCLWENIMVFEVSLNIFSSRTSWLSRNKGLLTYTLVLIDHLHLLVWVNIS